MQAFKLFIRLWGVHTVRDTQCGFKLLTRPAACSTLSNLRLNRWIFDVELIYLAEAQGILVKEVPISWKEVGGSKLSLAVDSVQMAADMAFMRLAYWLGIWKIHKVSVDAH